MGRLRITPDQRIYDAFAELEADEQKELLKALEDLHRFSLKRDGRARPPAAEATRNGKEKAGAGSE